MEFHVLTIQHRTLHIRWVCRVVRQRRRLLGSMGPLLLPGWPVGMGLTWLKRWHREKPSSVGRADDPQAPSYSTTSTVTKGKIIGKCSFHRLLACLVRWCGLLYRWWGSRWSLWGEGGVRKEEKAREVRGCVWHWLTRGECSTQRTSRDHALLPSRHAPASASSLHCGRQPQAWLCVQCRAITAFPYTYCCAIIGVLKVS